MNELERLQAQVDWAHEILDHQGIERTGRMAGVGVEVEWNIVGRLMKLIEKHEGERELWQMSSQPSSGTAPETLS